MSSSAMDDKLAAEITSFFVNDQRLAQAYGPLETEHPEASQKWKERAIAKTGSPNFYLSDRIQVWAAEDLDAPDLVKEMAVFQQSLVAFVQSTIQRCGWPTRSMVGDQPGAMFFFLFGHIDNANEWRRTQLGTLEVVCKQDGVNPRLYAHLVDRMASVAGHGQIYGSVMGPVKGGEQAELYWKLQDDVAATNKRRIELGLPTMEHDLQKFRSGATIGQYMTPMTAGMQLGLDDVYNAPKSLTTS